MKIVPVYKYAGTVTLTGPVTAEGVDSAEAELFVRQGVAPEATVTSLVLERVEVVGEREVE